MRLLSIEVSDEGLTLSWGLAGTEIVRVRVVGDEVLVKVSEEVRKAVVDEVVRESVTCANDLGKCSERVKPRLGRGELVDGVRRLVMMVDEGECVPHEEVVEYASLKGFGREDAEAVIKELIDEGDIEERGSRCYAPAEFDDPLDP